MTAADLRAALLASHDQDAEHAKQWWRETPIGTKAAIWDAVTKLADCDDPAHATIGRLAVFGFTHLALIAYKPEDVI